MFDRRRKPVDPGPAVVPAPDEGMQQIDRWEEWHIGAQLAVLATVGLSADGLAREQAAARALSAAVANKMRDDYRLTRERQPHAG